LKPAFSSPWSTESFRIYLTYEELKLCIGMNSPQLSI